MNPLKLLRRDPVTADSDELKVLDGYLLRLHRGQLPAGEHELLRRLAQRLEMTDQQLAQRQARVVKRKADEAAAREAQRNPKLVDGEVIEQLTVTPLRLRYAGLDTPVPGCIEAYVRADPLPLPPAAATKWCRAEHDDEREHKYLLTVIRDLYAGKVRPGYVACVRRSGDRFGPIGAGIRTFLSDEPLVSFRGFPEWSWLRLPGQSQKQMNGAFEEFREALQKADEANGLVPAGSGRSTRRW